MKIHIEGCEGRQLVRGTLDGPDRAQTQAADLLTVELQNGACVTVKQNPVALKGANIRVGACAWDGALVMAAYLDAQPPGEISGLRCVELGAGVGLVGLVLARLGAHVTLTDRPQATSFARMSTGKSKLLPSSGAAASSQENSGSVRIEGLEWGAPGYMDVVASLASAGVDLVVATDCVYIDPDGSVPSSEHFMAACSGLCQSGTRVLISFETRSSELREHLLAAARAKFSRVEELPLTSLPQAYQLQHIELYEMRL